MSAEMQLIDKPECPFCWRVRLALLEQGRPFCLLDRSDPDVQRRWEQLSPQRTVPVLIDGEQVFTESSEMLDYLVRTGPGLMPEDGDERARVQELMRYGDQVLGKAIREVIFEKRKPQAEWDQERIARGREGYLAALPALEEMLGERLYFAGTYSLAECVLLPRVALATINGVEVPEDLPALRAWFDRLVQRASFAASCINPPGCSRPGDGSLVTGS